MGIDHLPHPDRLATEIEIVGAGCRACRHQFRAVELIRADCGQDGSGLIDHGRQGNRIAGVSGDQSRVGRGADRIANRSELVQAASSHRPFQIGLFGVARRQIFSDELAGEAGSAIDNDVEFRRWLHLLIPWNAGSPWLTALKAESNKFEALSLVSIIAAWQIRVTYAPRNPAL